MDDNTFHTLIYKYNDDPLTNQDEWSNGVRDACNHHDRGATSLFAENDPYWVAIWEDMHYDYVNGYRVAWDIASDAVEIEVQ